MLVSGLGHGIIAVTMPSAFIWMHLLDFFKYEKINMIKFFGIFLIMNTTIVQLASNINKQTIDYIVSIPVFLGLLGIIVNQEINRRKNIVIEEKDKSI